MLPREHRITRGADFRAVMRGGSRAGGDAVVVSVRLESRGSSEQQTSVGWRCGLIVSKAVGNSVVRHRSQRRLRHLIRELLDDADGPLSEVDGRLRADVVLRALPQITALDHAGLHRQLRTGLDRAVGKAVRRRASDAGPGAASRAGTGEGTGAGR